MRYEFVYVSCVVLTEIVVCVVWELWFGILGYGELIRKEISRKEGYVMGHSGI